MSQGGPVALLPDWDDRLAWHKQTGVVTASEILRGDEDTALVVVLASSASEPSRGDLQAMWHERAGRSADPVLVAVQYQHSGTRQVALLGVTSDAVPVMGVEDSIAERLLAHALAQTSPSGLVTEMRRVLGSLHGGLGAGFRNEGLFATHVLDQQPSRSDWQTWCDRSVPLLTSRGSTLLTALGYSVDPVPEGFVLRDPSGDGARRAAAVLLTEDESLDNPLSKFHGSNAVTHGLALARREGVPWLVLMGGPVMRLFAVDPDVGVGRKGQTQTYAEIDLSLLADDKAGYLSLLFAPDALAPDGAVSRLLLESSKFAAGLSERLRDRIYEDVIPALATSVADRMGIAALPAADQRVALDEAYHRAMIVLFRLLFVAYAEDRGLLPLDVNEAYTSNALKTLGRRILDDLDAGFSTTSTSIWTDLTQVWDVIDTGDLEGMGVPAYNGGLFTRDATKNASGAATYDLRLTNNQIGPVLRGLLIDETADGVLGMVDFRSLSVREFGTIYEGLLASGLGIADTDLTVDSNDTYVPATKGDTVVVQAGTVYFHSRSGSRKATGSYFTKPFAVEHLLDTALEPALDDHLDRVKRLLDKEATKAAAETLFDFRVADLSMGSAHFLVAAVDRIEARFSAFLIENPIPDVDNELASLRATAAIQLGLAPDEAGIDNSALLRRQIARRCVYGIDINEIAVELARLGMWIHTFVPGLPLSFLNHGLIWGNALTGVGTLDEITTALADAGKRETKSSGNTDSVLLEMALADFMDRAGAQLDLLGRLADASIADVKAASETQEQIETALAPLSALCDLITAERTTRHLKKGDPDKILLSAGGGKLFTVSDADSLEGAVLTHPDLGRAREIAAQVQAAHMPVRFPEVLRRERPGFDVILGNPPWEKLKVEEDGWWGAHFPGLRSMPQRAKNSAIAKYRAERGDLLAEYESDCEVAKSANAILASGPFPGLRDATDIDLFAAFCWRFWHEVRHEGRIGVVLPRTAMGGAGTGEWRKTVLRDGSITDLTTLTNTARWAFDMEPRYTVVLATIRKGGREREVLLRGPFGSLSEFTAGIHAQDAPPAARVSAETVMSWSDTATIPLVPASDVDVFAALRRHPSLDAEIGQWSFRPIRELHTTDNKPFYDFNLDDPDPSHSLPIWTGASFDLWSPGSGRPYAFADPSIVIPFLVERRLTSAKRADTAFVGEAGRDLGSAATLPMNGPRIAFRDVTNRTNTRTMVCALIPAGVALVEVAPYLVRQRGTEQDEAFLLGVMSSIPFDWYARRFVELHMKYHLLNTFPIPRVDTNTGFRLAPNGDGMDATDMRPVRDRLVAVAGALAACDGRFNVWAQAVGVAVGSVKTTADRDSLIAEVDALVALLYGLSEDHLTKLFSSFHRGWDYHARLDAVLAHYRAWLERLDGQGVLS